MAIEEAVLESVNSGSSPSTLRLWNNSTSVIVGVADEVEKEVNVNACTSMKVPVVRRFTGGGTIYNDLGNLNWSFFVRHSHDHLWEEGIANAYRRLSSPIVQALRSLGVQATFHPPNALFHGHFKVSGMAMYVKRSAILCHGTLLVDADLGKLKLLLRRLKDPVENLNNLLDSRLTMSQIKQAISDEASSRSGSLVAADRLQSMEKESVLGSSLDPYQALPRKRR